MTVSVGQQIAGGKIVVAAVDQNDFVTTVSVPADTDPSTQQPLVIQFTPAVTVAKLESLFGA